MKCLDIKNLISNNNGITLISLTITIIVLIIIASVSINIGTEAMDDARLDGFYMKLEIIQKRVDDIASTNEKYIIKNNDGTETIVELKNTGSNLTGEQITFVDNVLQEKELTNITSANNFRYFTSIELEEKLDLLEMEDNVFIDFNNRIVISESGVTIGEKTYYMLEDEKYFVEHNEDKNVGTIESLNYTAILYGDNKYKVTVTPSNTIGDIGGTGYIKYKKLSSKYWNTSNNLEFVIEELGTYNIIYVDKNNNSIEDNIYLVKDEENNTIIITKLNDVEQ